MKRALLIVGALIFLTGIVHATTALTVQQTNNLGVESDINEQVWEVKSWWKWIQARESLIDSQVRILQAQNIGIGTYNWSDINLVSEVNINAVGQGTE